MTHKIEAEVLRKAEQLKEQAFPITDEGHEWYRGYCAGIDAILESAQAQGDEAVLSHDEIFDTVHAYFRQQNSVLSFHKAQTDMVIRALSAAGLLRVREAT